MAFGDRISALGKALFRPVRRAAGRGSPGQIWVWVLAGAFLL